MGVREPRIPLRYLQIDPAASRHGVNAIRAEGKPHAFKTKGILRLGTRF